MMNKQGEYLSAKYNLEHCKNANSFWRDQWQKIVDDYEAKPPQESGGPVPDYSN